MTSPKRHHTIRKVLLTVLLLAVLVAGGCVAFAGSDDNGAGQPGIRGFAVASCTS